MILTVQGFSGIAPRYAPYAIKENQAQTATDTRLWSGILEPLPGNTEKATLADAGGVRKTLFLKGTSATTASHWIQSTELQNICRTQVFGDTSGRLYFTRGTDGVPQFQGALDQNATDLAVPAPDDSAFTLTPDAGYTPGANDVQETRAYVYTYVRNADGWAEESAPSGVVTTTCYNGQTVVVGGFASLPIAPDIGASSNMTHRRFYRTSTGEQGTNYYFIGEAAIADISFPDVVLNEDLGEVLPSLDWNAPDDDLDGLVALAAGVFAAFKGKDVYFCEPYIPHAWPLKYVQTVEYDIVGLCSFGTNLLVLTKGTPYLISGTEPASMSMTKLDIEQSCVSRRSICRFGNGCLYASPDGLVYVGTDGSNIITQPYVTAAEWAALNPTTIHGYQHDNRYYGFHSSGGFIFDPSDASGALTVHTTVAQAGYSDLLTDTLYIVKSDHKVYSFATATGSPTTYTWKSKVFQLPAEINLSGAQVIAQSYDVDNPTVTFSLWVDGALKHSQGVTSAQPFRLPSGYRGRMVEFQLTGTAKVMQVHLTDAFAELKRV